MIQLTGYTTARGDHFTACQRFNSEKDYRNWKAHFQVQTRQKIFSDLRQKATKQELTEYEQMKKK